MSSLRRRLLMGTAGGAAGIVVLAGIGLYATIQTALWAQFDEALLDKAATLAALIETSGGHVEVEFTEAEMAEFARAERPEYFQVWTADGQPVARSPALSGDLPGPALQDPDGVRDMILPDGRPGRVAWRTFAARPDEDIMARGAVVTLRLSLARDGLDVHRTLAQLRWMLLGTGTIAVLLIVAVLAWLVARGLRPLDGLASEIAAVQPAAAGAGVALSPCPAELQPIVDCLNGLMGRVADALQREKTLTANVAHELRTPLAGLLATLEVTLAQPRDKAHYHATLEQCLTICRQTRRLVDVLLRLSRAEAGQESPSVRPIDVTATLHGAWGDVAERAARRRLTVTWQVPPGLMVRADPDQWAVVVANLLDNAVSHGDSDGRVCITVTEVGQRVHLVVVNPATGVAAGETERVFQRFWRGDRARSNTGGHFGLGLALCRTIVSGWGGAIGATVRDGAFEVAVSLPRG